MNSADSATAALAVPQCGNVRARAGVRTSRRRRVGRFRALLVLAAGGVVFGANAPAVLADEAPGASPAATTPASPAPDGQHQGHRGGIPAQEQAAAAQAESQITHPAIAFWDDKVVLTLDGYVAAAGTLAKERRAHRQTTLFNSGAEFNDSVKLGLNLECGPAGAYVSFFSVPARGAWEAGVLDAYLTWKHEWAKGHGVAVTAGKFTSSLGYEGFFPNERAFLTYALVAGIPGYQTGVRAEYTHGPLALGAAVVDSLQQADGFYRGDGNPRDAGFEFCASYTLDKRLKIFAGAGFDTDHRRLAEHGVPGHEFAAAADLFLDLWAEFKATDQLTLAAEIAHARHVADVSWLAQARWDFTDALSATLRASGAQFQNGTHAYTLGLCPSWTPHPHLLLRAEISGQFATGGARALHLGAQAILQF